MGVTLWYPDALCWFYSLDMEILGVPLCVHILPF